MEGKFSLRVLLGIIAVAVLIAGGYFAFEVSEEMDAPKEPVTIGVLQYLPILQKTTDGFFVGMQEIGYEKDEDVIYRYDKVAQSPAEVAELAQLLVAEDVDMIFAVTSVAANAALKAAKDAGKTHIPILYAHADNPVKAGLAQSLESSGNQATGSSVDLTLLTAKRLEFLKQINPSTKRLGVVLGATTVPAQEFAIAELRTQAKALDLELKEYVLQKPIGPESIAELKGVLGNVKKGDIDAIFQIPSPVSNLVPAAQEIVDFGRRLKIPTVMLYIGDVDRGGLFAYSHDHIALGKQSARIAEKILNGTAPTDIPIELPEKNILALNLKVAREIGVTFPESMLLWAEYKVE